VITQVDDFLWRGPRPKPEDYARIKAQFKSVISLEGLAEDEKEMVELAPVPVISLPISALEIYLTGLAPPYLYQIMSEVEAAPKPLLVHCQHGEDRTGLIIAVYRVTTCGWAREAAWTEAKHFGYHNWLNIGLNNTWSQVQ
jgi:hypothetical protein